MSSEDLRPVAARSAALDGLFLVLEPPPGGLTRLRARLRERARVRAAWGGGLVAVAAAVALFFVLSRPGPPPLPTDPTLLARIQPLPAGSVVAGDVGAGYLAVQRVELGEAGVVYYRVVGW